MSTEDKESEACKDCPPHCTGFWQNLSDTHCRYAMDRENDLKEMGLIDCPIRKKFNGRT
jgi:hypothetical protein